MTDGRSRSLTDMGTAMAEQVITETVRIDMTPTWEGLVDSLLLIFTESTDQDDRRHARSELLRMGRIADAYVAEHKDKKEHG